MHLITTTDAQLLLPVSLISNLHFSLLAFALFKVQSCPWHESLKKSHHRLVFSSILSSLPTCTSLSLSLSRALSLCGSVEISKHSERCSAQTDGVKGDEKEGGRALGKCCNTHLKKKGKIKEPEPLWWRTCCHLVFLYKFNGKIPENVQKAAAMESLPRRSMCQRHRMVHNCCLS